MQEFNWKEAKKNTRVKEGDEIKTGEKRGRDERGRRWEGEEMRGVGGRRGRR